MQPTTDRTARLFDELTVAWLASARCDAGICGCGEERACAYRRGHRDGLLRAYVIASGEHPGQVRARLGETYLAGSRPQLRPTAPALA